LGYVDATVVTLVEYLSASEVIRAFRNQALEAAALTLDEALLLLQSNIPVRVFLVTDISHGGDVIMGAPDISKVTTLRGKRVGVEASALGAYVISRALEQHGLALTDITVVPLEMGEHVTAYQAGKVDAVVTFEPVRTQLLALGARELFTSREIPGELVVVFVVLQAYFAAHPGNVRQVVDAWFRALDYFAAHPNDAASRMQKRLKIPPEDVLKSYGGLRLPNRTENRQLLEGHTPDLLPIAQRLRDVMLAKDLLRVPVHLDSLFSAAALPEDPS
jgi:NitT/TauT family transport system substrate-binding protein